MYCIFEENWPVASISCLAMKLKLIWMYGVKQREMDLNLRVSFFNILYKYCAKKLNNNNFYLQDIFWR